MKNNRQAGFTLIELMVVVVIVAILAAIALPSYSRYITQTRRSDAQVAIQRTANVLEKYYGGCNNVYTTDITNAARGCPGAAGVPADGSLGLGANGNISPDGHYVLTITVDTINNSCIAANGPCDPLPAGLTQAQCQARCGYTLTADPDHASASGRQRDDGKFRMDSRGIKQWDKNDDGDYNDPGENKWR